MNHLYYGDNLRVLRDSIADESVDLIYLDPPFNSNASYNQLFRGPDGKASAAQIEAFTDTWEWDDMVSGQALREVKERGPDAVARMLDAMVQFLGKNAMTAYLCMMAVRLVELHRVLKPTGSLYLHCDPTASHYLKVLLDAVFGNENYGQEIIWRRTNSHNFKARKFYTSHDVIFYYKKSSNFIFNTQYSPYSKEQLSRFKTDEHGRLYKAENMTFVSSSPSRKFTWRGTTPPENRAWGASLEQLEAWWVEGRILKRKDGSPRMDGLIYYLDELPGKPLDSIWDDVDRVGNTSGERLGYPTQKPVALLERILNASSNPGDVVLDPFCGCGTTVHAAQNLGRRWIGIDVTPIAVNLIIARLFKEFGSAVEYKVSGFPADLDGAREMFARDTPIKKEFEMWACGLIRAEPRDGGKKGADGGVDGTFWFGAEHEHRAIVSVKGGRKVSVQTVRELSDVVRDQGASIGVYLTLEEPTKPMTDWAAQAGTVTVEGFGPVPRIQIVTIGEAMRRGPEAVNTPLRHAVYFRGKKTDRSGDKQTAMDL